MPDVPPWSQPDRGNGDTEITSLKSLSSLNPRPVCPGPLAQALYRTVKLNSQCPQPRFSLTPPGTVLGLNPWRPPDSPLTCVERTGTCSPLGSCSFWGRWVPAGSRVLLLLDPGSREISRLASHWSECLSIFLISTNQFSGVGETK